MIHLPSLRRFTKTDNGTATIEFVVAIPMFLAALAFAFEFGQIFLAHQGTVDNVRAAARYLSRVDLTNDAKLCAETLVRTGKLNIDDGVCDLPGPGDYPSYLSPANANIDINLNYGLPGQKRVRIKANVDVPLTIFGFVGSDIAKIPFVVVEDLPAPGI